MNEYPQPTAAVRAVPATTPFVAPEELARRTGRTTLVRLGANESSFGPSPLAIEAMQAAVMRTSVYGDPESYALRTQLAIRHGCAVENIVVGSGIDDLLGLIVRTYCAPGDRIVASRGTYPTLNYHAIGYGATVVPSEPTADGGVKPEALAALARSVRPAIVYVANPDNPSGTFVSRDAIAQLRSALPPDALFVLDEAYADFVSPDDLPPEEIDPRMIRLRTFSKAYGMAGARIGYALAIPDAIGAFQKIRLHFGVNRTAQWGALAALEDRAFVRDVVDEIARGREEYHALGRRLGVRTLPSSTNFVCFEIGTLAQAVAMVGALLERGVFVRKPGEPPIDGFIRVTVGTPEERALFADAFTAALDVVRERANA
jgi:histidinol-phosphate aminotransferase